MIHTEITGSLCDAWGRDFTGLTEWPVPAPEIPREPDEVLELIRAAPRESLELVACQGRPGPRMPNLELPRDLAELLDPETGRTSILRVGNVAVWNGAIEGWCLRWADWVRESIGARSERVVDVRAEVYLTSPNGVTAFHADPSHNFTLQVRGRREMRAFPNRDPRLIDEESRPGVYLHRACYPVYREECEDRAVRFQLAPERSCYIPPLSAHWIQNGDELSISYVISVRTWSEIREKLVHGMNARLRAVGWHPSGFGSKPLLDDWKARCEERIRRSRYWVTRRLLRRPARPHIEPIVLGRRNYAV